MKKVKTVSEYLAAAPPQSRPMLKKLRATIRAIVPSAKESIYYQLPAFRSERAIVAYGGFSDHCSLFPLSGSVVERFRRELAGYETSRGTIRIPFDRPLPASLIRKIVRARVAQNKERGEPASRRNRK
ncbi:MAG TPA: DUF1801 domain-containing protein [Bacteroidota bacterium]|nr:DUF1801 domain-containing protein [Bacteroidota bacterium]